MDANANEMNFPGLDRLEKRLPAFVTWLREGWSDARPLEVRRSGKFDWLVDNGTPMVDAYDATGGDIADPRHAIWCVLGVGTGKALCNLIEKAGQHVARILMMEDDAAVWKTALETSNLAQYMADGRVFAVWSIQTIGSSAGEAISNPILLGSVNQTLYFSNRGQAERDPEKPARYVHAFGDFLKYRFSALGNSAEDTLIGFRQIIRNYPNLLRSYSLKDLEKKFCDRVAIVISAGPSLEKNVHLLKDVQDKCILIAVDTILRKLLPMGIRPHFVVAIERVREVYDYHFADIEEVTTGVIPVISSVCVPEICGTWKGPFIIPFKTLPLDRWFATASGLSVLASGSSCAHMGIPLAEALGCRTVALVGQDLAYASDGSTHSRGTGWDDKKEYLDSAFGKTFDAPGALGGTVRTNNIWWYFKKTFEDLIAVRPNMSFFNATEGGLRIEGAETITLDDFLEREVRPAQPFSSAPIELLETKPLSKTDKRDRFVQFILEAARSLSDYDRLLDSLDGAVNKAAAPGLSPGRRQGEAFAVAAVMDRLVASSPIMSFILQAHIAGCARVINETKHLDNSEELHVWKKELSELLGTARAACASAREMLDTLVRFIEEEPQHESVYSEIGCPEGALTPEQAERAWETAKEKNLELFAVSLFGRFDFREGKWNVDNALSLGRKALALGLVERGRKLLSSLTQQPQVARDPSFWNDLALSHCLYDFGVEPDFESARVAFIRAMTLDPENEDRSRNYLAMEYLLQRRAEAAYLYAPEPSKCNAAAAIAQSWALVGKHSRAVEWYRRALEHVANENVRLNIEKLMERSRKKSQDSA